jgi:hypothetical protein
MFAGQGITVLDALGNKLARTVVCWDERNVYVCREEEFRRSIQESREPVCIGFNRSFVIGYDDPVKTDKGQFDSVLSQILRTPPKKESEIKGKPKEPKTAPQEDQQSDRQSEEA